MRILFIRHGQMEFRASAASDPAMIDRLFNHQEQGHLTDRGRREARAVAERLRTMGVDALYSSHLHRARETGEVIADTLGLPLEISERVAEIRVGSLAKRSRGERFVRRVTTSALPASWKKGLLSAALIPIYFDAWQGGKTVGGETAQEFAQRTEGFLADLAEQHDHEATIVVVAHGYLITTLTLGTGVRGRLRVARRPYIPNGAICEMSYRDGRLRSVGHADARHLPTRGV